MIQIEHERDLETLRQIGVLLDNENKRLIDKVHKLSVELARLRGLDETAATQLELSILRELEQARERVFRCDERREGKPPSRTENKRVGHGPRPQPQLPIVECHHALPADERKCDVCGGELEEMKGQFEESEVVTVVKRSFVVEHHRRQKYRCRCNANVVTAPGARKLIPGGRYSPEFAVEVALNKYADHIPLERQVRMMEREGLNVDTQTLWDQLNALARHLEPSYEALGRRVLESPVINVDETRWPVLGTKKLSPGCVWGVRSPEVSFYRILDSKSTEDGRKVLGDYPGTVVCDGYAVYEVLARAGPGFRLAHCWAHVLRKLKETSEQFPVVSSELLELIGQLYEVERVVPGPFPGDEQAQALRLRLRLKRSRPILQQIWDRAVSQRTLPRSEFGKAVRYMLQRWDGLTVFVEDPRVPLDNNAVERALRGPVVGRKNHYGSRSKRGTEVAAVFYTLCETAKLVNVEPRSYLLQAAYVAIDQPGTVTFPEQVTAIAPTA